MPASEEKTPYARALVSVPTSSQCFSGNTNRQHAHTQHGTARQSTPVPWQCWAPSIGKKPPYVRALVQSFLHDSPHTETHTHGRTLTQTQRRTALRHSCFLLATPLELPTGPPIAMGFSGDAAASSPPALGTFLRKSLGNRGGVHVGGGVDMRTSSGICGPNWDWKPRTGRGSRRAGKTSSRVRSSPNPEPTRPGFRGCNEGRSAMCDKRDAQIRRQTSVTSRWRAVPAQHRGGLTRDDLRAVQRDGGRLVPTLLSLSLLCRWKSSRTSCGEERRTIHPSSSRASPLVSVLTHLGCNVRPLISHTDPHGTDTR